MENCVHFFPKKSFLHFALDFLLFSHDAKISQKMLIASIYQNQNLTKFALFNVERDLHFVARSFNNFLGFKVPCCESNLLLPYKVIEAKR
jgi:hypothetical protein